VAESAPLVHFTLDWIYQSGYFSFMKRASITEAKNRLSALIDRVREGETIWITDRGRPVARLEPARGGGPSDPEGRLSRLERGGILRRGTAAPPVALIRRTGPRLRPGSSIVRAVVEEREKGL